MTYYNSIAEINERYSYEDTHPKGKGDPSKVSCGQTKDYNELQYILDKRLLPALKAKDGASVTSHKSRSIQALGETCELRNGQSRTEFYKLLEDKLKIQLPDPKHPNA